VVWVRTCSKAQDAIAESGFDMVILDLGLPDGDGMDLLHEWRKSGFNEPVLRLLEAGFVITQATGIRRLSDKQSRDPTKRVISLRALLDEIKTERELLTREVYLACHGLPYDPAPAKKRFYDRLVSSGQILSYVGMDTNGQEAWASSEAAHSIFDKLSNTSVAGRSREDLISITWFDSLESKIKSCKDICVLTNKFIAHAAHSTNLVGLSREQTHVTLSQLKTCHQAIMEVAASIGVQIFGDSVATIVPVPQFDLLENLDKRWIGDGGTSKARGIWERNCDEINALTSLSEACLLAEAK
jgi:CheY-like chemotaxis protein